MDLSAVSGVGATNVFQTPTISSRLLEDSELVVNPEKSKSAFSTVFESAMDMIQEANAYSNAAEEEEIKYALGESDSIHDLQIAQQKANVSLQYTVAVRDAFMEGYNSIMNIQF